jgi:hypothetical protein
VVEPGGVVRPININAQIQLTASPSLQGMITNDSIDGKLETDCAAADTTPPLITASPSISPNANGWNNSDVTVTFACTDSGSGVDTGASNLAPVTLTASGTATGTCVDNAGNIATAAYSAQIDKVAPTIAIASPVAGGLYGKNAAVASSFSCADAGSGVATCTGAAALNTSAIGAQTFSVTAVDLAGNSATSAAAYSVGGKNECKGGGHKNFLVPAFGNQGQCVSSFVP